ncbi:MAG TPA: DUF222 domain-containing protein, partial [Micrococcaceae bacterium]
MLATVRSLLATAAEAGPGSAALLDPPSLVRALLDIERIARLAGFLQITAASAVDAANLAANTPERVDQGKAVFAFDTVTAPAGSAARGGSASAVTGAAAADCGAGSVRSGFRGTAEYLQAVLGIGIRDARTRLSTGAAVLPSVTLTGVPVQPRYPVLGAAAAAGLLCPDALRISLATLKDARSRTTVTGLAVIEESLVETAVARDPDFLAQVAVRWRHRLDQDGPEPSVSELAARQGIRLYGLRRGLYHLEIDADQYQYETVLTVLNAGTNPRTKNNSTTSDSNGSVNGSADSAAVCGGGTSVG